MPVSDADYFDLYYNGLPDDHPSQGNLLSTASYGVEGAAQMQEYEPFLGFPTPTPTGALSTLDLDMFIAELEMHAVGAIDHPIPSHTPALDNLNPTFSHFSNFNSNDLGFDDGGHDTAFSSDPYLVLYDPNVAGDPSTAFNNPGNFANLNELPGAEGPSFPSYLTPSYDDAIDYQNAGSINPDQHFGLSQPGYFAPTQLEPQFTLLDEGVAYFYSPIASYSELGPSNAGPLHDNSAGVAWAVSSVSSLENALIPVDTSVSVSGGGGATTGAVASTTSEWSGGVLPIPPAVSLRVLSTPGSSSRWWGRFIKGVKEYLETFCSLDDIDTHFWRSSTGRLVLFTHIRRLLPLLPPVAEYRNLRAMDIQFIQMHGQWWTIFCDTCDLVESLIFELPYLGLQGDRYGGLLVQSMMRGAVVISARNYYTIPTSNVDGWATDQTCTVAPQAVVMGRQIQYGTPHNPSQELVKTLTSTIANRRYLVNSRAHVSLNPFLDRIGTVGQARFEMVKRALEHNEIDIIDTPDELYDRLLPYMANPRKNARLTGRELWKFIQTFVRGSFATSEKSLFPQVPGEMPSDNLILNGFIMYLLAIREVKFQYKAILGLISQLKDLTDFWGRIFLACYDQNRAALCVVVQYWEEQFPLEETVVQFESAGPNDTDTVGLQVLPMTPGNVVTSVGF